MADYLPLVTSYDYDAALDEAGRPTRKFFLFRDVIQRRTGITPPRFACAVADCGRDQLSARGNRPPSGAICRLR